MYIYKGFHMEKPLLLAIISMIILVRGSFSQRNGYFPLFLFSKEKLLRTSIIIEIIALLRSIVLVLSQVAYLKRAFARGQTTVECVWKEFLKPFPLELQVLTLVLYWQLFFLFLQTLSVLDVPSRTAKICHHSPATCRPPSSSSSSSSSSSWSSS